jgi:DNA-binding NtrC family response regulator
MKQITALLVMSGDSRATILESLEACGVHVIPSCGLADARTILGARPVDLIVTGSALADGDWRDVLAYRTSAGLRSEVIICAPRLESALCSEAFARGAWEVVSASSSGEDLRKTIETAASRRYMQSITPRPRVATGGGAS